MNLIITGAGDLLDLDNTTSIPLPTGVVLQFNFTSGLNLQYIYPSNGIAVAEFNRLIAALNNGKFPASLLAPTTLAPTITSVSEPTGVTAGDTISVVGTNFSPQARVFIGGVDVTNTMQYTDAQDLSVVAPPLPNNTNYALAIYNPDGGLAITGIAYGSGSSLVWTSNNPTAAVPYQENDFTITGTGFLTSGITSPNQMRAGNGAVFYSPGSISIPNDTTMILTFDSTKLIAGGPYTFDYTLNGGATWTPTGLPGFTN